MSGLPDTTRTEPRRRTTPPAYIVALLALILLGAAAVYLLPRDAGGPTPGEGVYADGIEDIAAGTGDAPFPRSDASRFDGGTRAVRVYLRVEDAPAARRMVATVERTGRSSALALLFGETGVRAEDGGGGRLTVSEDGASGVASFVVRAMDGGPLPAGGYGIEVRYLTGDEGGAGRVVARKYFEIGDPQT